MSEEQASLHRHLAVLLLGLLYVEVLLVELRHTVLAQKSGLQEMLI
jgi:hypothetical protein